MSSLRREVLRQFKSLHRTSQRTFNGDEGAISQFRERINDNFRKNKNVNELGEVKSLLTLARDVETELKVNVLQAIEQEPGVFRVRVTENTPLLDNVMFNENIVIPARNGSKCCSDETK